jgi:hypothetical protein
MPKENLIRDKLAQTLEELEPGLTLVEVNHKLPNDAGAKGFIDILARDRVGNLVIDVSSAITSPRGGQLSGRFPTNPSQLDTRSRPVAP